jgi:hypothetical protein
VHTHHAVSLPVVLRSAEAPVTTKDYGAVMGIHVTHLRKVRSIRFCPNIFQKTRPENAESIIGE